MAFVGFIFVLPFSLRLAAQAQQGAETPPWETGREGEPAAEEPPDVETASDIETPPDFEAPPSDEEPADEAADAQSPVDSRADAGIILGGKVGGGIGVGDFGATPVFELELGYAPDLGDALGRSLEIFLIGQYAQPGLDGSAAGADPRLGAEPFSYEVSQQMLSFALGALFRFDVGSELLMPYGGLGARLYLLNTDVEGQLTGEPLGGSSETQSAFGLLLLGGLDVFVGPGALLGELSFGWAAIDGYVVRDASLGSLSLAVGYRVML
jgi:hypothetical protein